MAYKGEFGIREGGLPGPEEISDEERRTKEKKGAHRRDFLAPENIPNWFTDLGVEREGNGEEDTRFQKLVEDLRKLDWPVQQEISADVLREKERGYLKDREEIFERVRYLVDQNLRLARKKARESRGQHDVRKHYRRSA
ncbi:MAG: hypothetical protein HYW91_00990 [Candidatus Sungbacteria bacterium]|nr:hypothetical protein [Candidatus Sungbacteria bacterium]